MKKIRKWRSLIPAFWNMDMYNWRVCLVLLAAHWLTQAAKSLFDSPGQPTWIRLPGAKIGLPMAQEGNESSSNHRFSRVNLLFHRLKKETRFQATLCFGEELSWCTGSLENFGFAACGWVWDVTSSETEQYLENRLSSYHAGVWSVCTLTLPSLDSRSSCFVFVL